MLKICVVEAVWGAQKPGSGDGSLIIFSLEIFRAWQGPQQSDLTSQLTPFCTGGQILWSVVVPCNLNDSDSIAITATKTKKAAECGASQCDEQSCNLCRINYFNENVQLHSPVCCLKISQYEIKFLILQLSPWVLLQCSWYSKEHVWNVEWHIGNSYHYRKIIS